MLARWPLLSYKLLTITANRRVGHTLLRVSQVRGLCAATAPCVRMRCVVWIASTQALNHSIRHSYWTPFLRGRYTVLTRGWRGADTAHSDSSAGLMADLPGEVEFVLAGTGVARASTAANSHP